MLSVLYILYEEAPGKKLEEVVNENKMLSYP